MVPSTYIMARQTKTPKGVEWHSEHSVYVKKWVKHEKIWWINVHNLTVTLLISSLNYVVRFTSCDSVSKKSDNGSYTDTRWQVMKTVNPFGLKTIPQNFGRLSCLHMQVEHRRGKFTLVRSSERTSPNSWAKCFPFWHCSSSVQSSHSKNIKPVKMDNVKISVPAA
jgi:hypothetical protein